MIIIWLMENDQPSSVSERFKHPMSVLQQFWLFSSSFMTYFQLLPDMISLLRQSWVTLCIFYIMHLPVRLHHHHPQDEEQSHSTLKSDQASCNTIRWHDNRFEVNWHPKPTLVLRWISMSFLFGALPIDTLKIKHTKKLKEIPSRDALENLPEKACMYAFIHLKLISNLQGFW